MTTFFDFLDDKFKLSKLKIMQQLNGKNFSALEKEYANYASIIEDYQLVVQIIKYPTPDRVRFDIFDRVNRGGTPLNKQEMRNALYQGKATGLLKRITKNSAFQQATGKGISSKHMKDRYIALRAIAFTLLYTGELKDIKGKFEMENNDKARLLKSLLMSLQTDPPYWDTDAKVQDGMYYIDNRDVSGTSIAEAAARREFLLSFADNEYIDKMLLVLHEQEKLKVPSIFSFTYLSKVLYENGNIDINEYVKRIYAGTRLDFGKIELDYGMQFLEKEEIVDCLRNFDRFVSYENWNDIFKDNSLVYKAYSPSQKEKDWFRDLK